MKRILLILIIVCVSISALTQDIGHTREEIIKSLNPYLYGEPTIVKDKALLHYIFTTVDLDYPKSDIDHNLLRIKDNMFSDLSYTYVFTIDGHCRYMVYQLGSIKIRDYTLNKINTTRGIVNPLYPGNVWIQPTSTTCYYYALYKYIKKQWLIIKY